MNGNLYMAHEHFHTKHVRALGSARYTQCAHVGKNNEVLFSNRWFSLLSFISLIICINSVCKLLISTDSFQAEIPTKSADGKDIKCRTCIVSLLHKNIIPDNITNISCTKGQVSVQIKVKYLYKRILSYTNVLDKTYFLYERIALETVSVQAYHAC